MKITRESLYFDISNMSYVVADIYCNNLDSHRVHQTFDICSEGNVDRVDRVLDSTFADVALAVRRIAFAKKCKSGYKVEMKTHHDKAMSIRLEELVREYLVTSVLADWLSVTIPEAADIWMEKAEEAHSSLFTLATMVNIMNPVTRRIPPI